jgi:hypothetical protein
VINLKAAPDIKVFADSPDYHVVRSYLNVHELLAVGVLRGVFSHSVCRAIGLMSSRKLARTVTDCCFTSLAILLRNSLTSSSSSSIEDGSAAGDPAGMLNRQ